MDASLPSSDFGIRARVRRQKFYPSVALRPSWPGEPVRHVKQSVKHVWHYYHEVVDRKGRRITADGPYRTLDDAMTNAAHRVYIFRWAHMYDLRKDRA